MNRKLNILVLGVGGNVSQGIVTALRHSALECNIIGACISSESLGLYFCDKAYISPYASDPTFIEWVSEICKKENIDIVLSGVEENLVALESHRAKLQELKIPFFNTPLELLKIGNDKLSTCKWLKDHGCNYPGYADASNKNEVEKLIDEVGFPLIAKPTKGKGSAGIIEINGIKDLELIPAEEYVLQEKLGDNNNEYTVGCYKDKKGKLSGMIIMQRWLKHGTTFKAQIIENDEIRKECEKICSCFNATGPLNIQLRMHKGKPTCFELNVRFSGTTPIRANWGFNDVEAFIKEYLLNEPYNLNPQSAGIAYRYYNEAYIDEKMIGRLKSDGHVENVHDYKNEKEHL